MLVSHVHRWIMGKYSFTSAASSYSVGDNPYWKYPGLEGEKQGWRRVHTRQAGTPAQSARAPSVKPSVANQKVSFPRSRRSSSSSTVRLHQRLVACVVTAGGRSAEQPEAPDLGMAMALFFLGRDCRWLCFSWKNGWDACKDSVAGMKQLNRGPHVLTHF
jgi:hypothetical protein